ncbi:hypothetical protein AB1Y20_017783 [Prymnesium parvum]|uniref:Calmodulin-lysine N-methyltransferase n=1 Tax=Prymnesium parvum TaxID=97485 RepID=A0AB34JM76_PRYPA
MASALSCVVGEHVLYVQPPARDLQSGGVLFSDPFDQEEEFDDTGLFGVWPAAYTLCRYLARHPELVRGERVLELGCGAGLPSLLCDRLGAASVVATDGTDEVIDQMHASFQSNACAGQVSAMRLDWGDTQQLLRMIADADVTLVIGTDLVYPLRDQQPLISSLSVARRRFPHLKVLLSEGCRDARTHARFEEALQALGTDGVVETEMADDKLFGSLRVDLYLLHAWRQSDSQESDDVEGGGEEVESACVLGETHDAGLRSQPTSDTRHTSLPQLSWS